jgi:hypothetical protein
MKTLRLLRHWVAEIYMLMSVVYYWVMTGTILNPIAASLLLILATLIVLKNRVLGMVIAIVFLLLNFYMVLALISEFNEFETFNERARELILFGSLYLGTNITISIVMLVKWGRLPFTRVSAAP